MTTAAGRDAILYGDPDIPPLCIPHGHFFLLVKRQLSTAAHGLLVS